FEEVEAVKVRHVDAPFEQAGRDALPVLLPDPLAGSSVDALRDGGPRDQAAGDLRSLTGHHERTVPARPKAPVDHGQHLLGPAHRVRRDRSKRVGDLKHGQCHLDPRSRAVRREGSLGTKAGAAMILGQTRRAPGTSDSFLLEPGALPPVAEIAPSGVRWGRPCSAATHAYMQGATREAVRWRRSI